MENQQCQLDRMTEKLDTVQNTLERLTQKQNLLDEKLTGITSKLEQEKIFMKDQLQGAQHEILERLRDIRKQADDICHTGNPCESSSLPSLITQSLQSWAHQIVDKLKVIDDGRVDTAEKWHQLTTWSHKIEEKMAELAHNDRENIKTFLAEIRSVKALVRGQTNAELVWLNNQIDKKLSDIGSVVRDIFHHQQVSEEEIVCSSSQVMETVSNQQDKAREAQCDKLKFLTGICDKQMQAILELEAKTGQIYSSALGVSREIQTSVEHILTETKQFITVAESTLRKSIAELDETMKSQSISNNEIVQTELGTLLKTVKLELETHIKIVTKDLDRQTETVKSEIKTQNEIVNTKLETQTERVLSAVELSKEDVKHLIQTEGDNSRKNNMEIENIQTLINSQDNTRKNNVEIEDIQTLINSLTENSKTMQANMTDVVKKIESMETSMKERHTAMTKNLNQYTTDIKDYIYNTKREIFAVTEKEAQLVRDRIERPLPSHGKYTFDFYVDNFKTLVRSGKLVHSPPWHINEIKSCVTGCAGMSEGGEMKVWLMYGRHSREVGLKPRSVKSLKVKATICDIYNKTLPPLDVGETTGFGTDEAGIPWNGDYGRELGVTSCDELTQKGYGDKEGYVNGALLIRYDVTIL